MLYPVKITGTTNYLKTTKIKLKNIKKNPQKTRKAES